MASYCHSAFLGLLLLLPSCVLASLHRCKVVGDPHLTTYMNQHAPLPVPCAYRLTSLQIRNTYKDPGFPFYEEIKLVVEVGNGRRTIEGRFYVTDVTVFISFHNATVNGPQGSFQTGEFLIGQDRNWVNSSTSDLLQRRVQTQYDAEKRLATLTILHASPRIQFRPVARSEGYHQRRTPGVFVQVGSDLSPVQNVTFPWVLASSVDDPTPFKEYARRSHVYVRSIGVYNILHMLPKIHDLGTGQQDPSCHEASKLLSECHLHFNRCVRFLHNAQVVDCIVQRGNGVMDVFVYCLQYSCKGSHVKCHQLKSLTRSCPDLGRVIRLSSCENLNI